MKKQFQVLWKLKISWNGKTCGIKLTDWIDDTNGLKYDYDDAGRVTKLTDYDASTLTYTYDDNGNVLTMNDYHSNETIYTYNDINQVATICK